MTKTRIYIAGHRGMVGSAIARLLEHDASAEIITRSRDEMDLTNQAAVNKFFAEVKIDQVYIAGAKVGGIYANTAYPAEFIYNNLMIEANVIHAAYKNGVKKLLFLGSSCIYPRNSPQPIPENALLGGHLEPSNEPYAIAKIAGIKLCESYNRQYGETLGLDYRCVMPTNLYGPADNYHPWNSHVIPALIARFHEASAQEKPTVTVWGTGEPRREFLHVDDMAAACVHLMQLEIETYESLTTRHCSHVNVGFGEDITISDLARLIARVTKYKGEILFDRTKPDGTPQKLLDISRIKKSGWQPRVSLSDGLRQTYCQYKLELARSAS